MHDSYTRINPLVCHPPRFRYNAPLLKLQGITMFELNPIRTQLDDLAERTRTLRGYL